MNKELEEAKSNLYEITNPCKEEIESNDSNATAILDIKDLKSLQVVLQSLENSIPKEVIENKIEELEKTKYDFDNNIRIYTLQHSVEFQISILKELLEGK